MVDGAESGPGGIVQRLRSSIGLQFDGIRNALSMLVAAQRRRFLVASGLQATLGLLDTVGIVMMGLVAAVLASGLDPGRMPSYVKTVLEFTGLGGLTLIQSAAVLGALAVGVMLAKSVLGIFFTRFLYRFLAQQQAQVSERLVRAFLNQPLLFVQGWSTAQAQYALTSGVGLGVVITLGGASSALAELFLFAVVAVVLLFVDPVLSLLVAGIFAVAAVLLVLTFGRRTSRDAASFRESTVRMDTMVFDALSTYREAMVLNRRDSFARRFTRLAQTNAETNADMQFVLEVPKYLLEALLVVVAFLLALFQLGTKEFPAAAATVALFLTAGFRLIPAMLRFQAAETNVRRGIEGARPTFVLAHALNSEIQEIQPLTAESRAVTRLREQVETGHQGFEAAVVVDRVTFSYPGSTAPALGDVSLMARPGASIALVGTTGAGKSTLADVILGVLQPDEGSVQVSGVDPVTAVQRWSGAIAYVPQAVALVDGTIRENVALGLPDSAIDDEWVWSALRQAHLADFLQSGREALNTVVGERGVRLSGGQRQRLGIARALFTKPLVLVMDEATSALDAETEDAITRTLRDLEGQVTTITVAHRLATVRFADELLFMRDGVIVARGSFEEVRAQEPDFARQAKLLGL